MNKVVPDCRILKTVKYCFGTESEVCVCVCWGKEEGLTAEKSDQGSRKAGISTESWRLRRNQSGEELEEYPGKGTASAKAQRHGQIWGV